MGPKDMEVSTLAEIGSLVERARGGELSAFDELVRRFQDMAVGYAYSLLGELPLAQDAAQEAFLAAYRDLAALRDPAAFPGWLRRIVFKHCDRIARRRPPPMLPLDAAVSVDPRPDPAAAALSRELRLQVREAVAGLPDGERVATTLFYMGGYSHAELAAFLDLSLSAVKSRLYSARKRLRERMIEMVKDTLHEERPSRDETFAQRVADLIRSVKFMLMAKDMDRAVAFYRDVIGLEVRLAGEHWSELALGDAIIALHAGGDGEYRPTGLSFEVDDIVAACEGVVAGGGKLLRPPEDRPGEPIKLADLADPEGNGFTISQPI